MKVSLIIWIIWSFTKSKKAVIIMTNRQMVMVKLIQLSDEQFAELLNDEIGRLTNGALCKECMEENNGECEAERNASVQGCPFNLVEWLQKKAG